MSLLFNFYKFIGKIGKRQNKIRIHIYQVSSYNKHSNYSLKHLNKQNQLKQNSKVKKEMINSLCVAQCEEALEMFSNYMAEINFIINKVKKSIYEISNIKMPISEVLVNNNLASLTANGKKTLDELKKIASILRGYSKSKTSERQQEQTHKSKYSSRSLRSRFSKGANCPSHISHQKIERTTTANGIDKQIHEISMVTFQMPTPQNKRHDNQNGQLTKKLKNYHSLRNLNRKSDPLSSNDAQRQNYQTKNFNVTFSSGIHNISPISNHIQPQSPMQRKRLRTSQKILYNSPISRVITQTQNKFKQCIEKQNSGMKEIIKNHYECLQILNDIHTHLKNKKSKKNSQPSSPIKELFNGGKVSAVYKAMTPSNKKQHPILVR